MKASSGVTLKTIAQAVGLSVSATSYALRGAPNIAEATVARVRAAAAALGYRPHARVSELMAHIRQSRRVPATERLALVWPDAVAPESSARRFIQTILTGARDRATARGYRLEEFWLHKLNGNPQRLAAILRARGMAGLVFAPSLQASVVTLAWPWDAFAMAVIGTAEWGQPLSRAAHHHYEAMRLALAQLALLGVRRPAVLLDHITNERAHRGWQGAWLAFAPVAAVERLLITQSPSPSRARLALWLRTHQPDALIVDSESQLARARAAGWRDDATNTVNLAWTAGQPHAGIEQGYALIAGHAVDLVIAQLQRNERGIPAMPRTLLSPGTWVPAAASLAVKAPRVSPAVT
jgi:LacI family transcriptional regulator